MAPMGRQWFNLTFRDPGEMVRGVKHASPTLNAFLDAELKRHTLPPRALALVGFSQGTMLALNAGLTRRPAPAAIVGYSGALATVEALPKDPGTAPAILLVHGDMDEVIPVDAMFIAREQLAQAVIAVEWHVAQGIGHGIDAEGLRLGGAFLKQAFSAAQAVQSPS
jgi:phospholipase/carboxylesterase